MHEPDGFLFTGPQGASAQQSQAARCVGSIIEREAASASTGESPIAGPAFNRQRDRELTNPGRITPEDPAASSSLSASDTATPSHTQIAFLCIILPTSGLPPQLCPGFVNLGERVGKLPNLVVTSQQRLMR